MASSDKAEHEAKEDQDVTDHSTQGSKKGKKSEKGTANTPARKRTKTGCLTCRKRRVKCDEQKPTCRNCDKSRRVCAGYQSTTGRHSQLPSQVHDTFPPFQPPPSEISYGQQGYAFAQTPFTDPASDYFDPAMQQPHHVAQHSAMNDWAAYHDTLLMNNPAQWSPSQDSWSSTTMTHPLGYSFDMHAGGAPVMQTPSYSAYPGRHLSYASTKNPSHQQNEHLSRSTSSMSVPPEISVTHADSGKSSFRRAGPVIDYAVSSRTALEWSRGHGTHGREASNPYARRQLFGDDEDPNDPWDVDSDIENNDSSSLVTANSSRNWILDERMAYIMSHFRNYLRPCLSLWERPLVFDGTSTLAEKLPTLALSCRGLLHGVMAVSALHLAILHHTSEVVPLKHFVIASKKLNNLLQAPQTRHKVETLGLCLLLAFYSVILADHAKWVMHLKGCSAFLMEHDFAGFLRAVQLVRQQKGIGEGPQAESLQKQDLRQSQRLASLRQVVSDDDEWAVDQDLVRQLSGQKVDYATQQQSCSRKFQWQQLSQHEVDEWRTKTDLLSWYLKMDIFQSTLSGDRLLLPYKNWRFFAPRGKIGRLGKLYASMDHLLLVLGRLADFGAIDRVRKQRKVVATGGEWRPEPGFLDPPKRGPVDSSAHSRQPSGGRSSQSTSRPSANEGRLRTQRSNSNAPKTKRNPPLFFGMMPPPQIPPSMLSSFHVMDTELHRATTPEAPRVQESNEEDLATATKKAMEEHAAISEALETWKTALGEDFDNPLPAHSSDPGRPFAPVLRYADPLLGCMWAFYHFAKILLRRYHPHSPPAMMVSAIVNARFTASNAAAVGRIFAGLLETQAEIAREGSINPTLVAALQEITFPLMFAGVQYTDPAQRQFTVDNLIDVANDSGWKTAFSVVSALEKAWAAQGNYQQTLKQRSPADAQRYDPNASSSGSLATSPEAQHESRFGSHDRRLIDRFSDLRAYWAIGVVSSPDDIGRVLRHLNLGRDS